jgi:hypothetical protein
MSKITLKSFYFFPSEPVDVKCSKVDVFGTIVEKGNEIKFSVEVATPDFFVKQMQDKNTKFISPINPCIMVNELIPSVVREAIEAFLNETDDGFWLKLYALTEELTVSDLDNLFDRRTKRQAEIEAN